MTSSHIDSASGHRARRAEWLERLSTLVEPTEIGELARRAREARLAELLNADDLDEIERAALEHVQELTGGAPQEAIKYIIGEVLPLLFVPVPAEERVRRFTVNFVREVLPKWMEQYPAEATNAMRGAVLDALREEAERGPVSAEWAWAVSAVGYSRDDVVEVLWRQLSALAFAEPPADELLWVLAGLCRSREEAERVRDVALARLVRSPSVSLLGVLARVAFTVPIAEALSLRMTPPQLSQEAGQWHQAYLQLIASIQNAQTEHIEVQARVLEEFAALALESTTAGWLALGSSFFPECDDPRVPPTLLELISGHTVGASDEAGVLSHAQYLWLLRAQATLHPRQLAGWREEQTTAQAGRVLAAVARSGSRTPAESRMTTEEARHKELVWRILARAGVSDARGWIQDALGTEENGFVQRELLRQATNFSFEELPHAVVEILRRKAPQREQVAVDADLVAKAAATELAASIPTRGSLEALLDSQYQWKGRALRDGVDAIAAVSQHLARSRKDVSDDVGRLLRERAFDPETPPWTRTGAMVALTVVLSDRNAPEATEQLWQVYAACGDALQPEEASYVRGLAITALGAQGGALSPEMWQELYRLAESEEGEVGWRAAGTLLRVADEDKAESTVRARMHLAGRPRGGLTEAEPALYPSGEWAARVLGMLFTRWPQKYLEEVCERVLHGAWWESGQLEGSIIAVWRGEVEQAAPAQALTGAGRERLVAALAERVAARSFDYEVEAVPLTLLARMEPGRLYALFAEYGEAWGATSRFIIARALRSLDAASLGERGLELLLRLAQDSDREVRLEAHTSLGEIAPDTLETWVTWGLSQEDWSLNAMAIEATAFLETTALGGGAERPGRGGGVSEILELRRFAPDRRVRAALNEARAASRKHRAVRSAHRQLVETVLAGGAVHDVVHWGDCVREWGTAHDAEQMRRLVASSPDVSFALRSWLGGVAEEIDSRTDRERRSAKRAPVTDLEHLMSRRGEVAYEGVWTEVHLTFWQQLASGGDGTRRWGGAAELGDQLRAELTRAMAQGNATVLRCRIASLEGQVMVTSISSDGFVLFSGQGSYPF